MTSRIRLLVPLLGIVLCATLAFAQTTQTTVDTIVRCDRDAFVLKSGDAQRTCSWSSIDGETALKLLTTLHTSRERIAEDQLDTAARFKIAVALCRVGHQKLGRQTIKTLTDNDPTLAPQAVAVLAELDSDIGIVRRTARVTLAQSPAWKYALEFRSAQRIEAVLTYKLTAPALSANHWLLIAPLPPTLPSQNNISVALSPGGTSERELNRGRTVLTARYAPATDAAKNSFDASATFRADLFARRLVARNGGEQSKSDPSASQFLGAGSDMNFDSGTFQTWLMTRSLRPVDGENDIDFAHRVFAAVIKGFDYDYAEKMDRDITHICQLRKSDCGGLSMVFVAALSGVPARLLAGRWAMSAKDGEQLRGVPYYQWHVKAEFYSNGVGWVPVDCASAVLHDHNGDGSRYFGNDPGDFLVLHVDRDFILDTPCGQKTMEWLQDVWYWASGSGNFDGKRTSESWKVSRQQLVSAN